MSLLQQLFPSIVPSTLNTYNFWQWFCLHHTSFHLSILQNKEVDDHFFELIYPQLHHVHPGICCLAGIVDSTTIELIFTANGIPEHIVFVEELVEAAPLLSGWKFTALKQASNEKTKIIIGEYVFDKSQLSFYPINSSQYPDEIDLVFAYDSYTSQDQHIIDNGTYLYLSNYLGELYATTSIDNFEVISTNDAQQALIPINKLKSYLSWRTKEFSIIPPDHMYCKTAMPQWKHYTIQVENGEAFCLLADTTLLNFPFKIAYPWMMVVSVALDNTPHQHSIPRNILCDFFEELENDLNKALSRDSGNLLIAKKTEKEEYTLYWACQEFRHSSKIAYKVLQKYIEFFSIDYSIYKDKYWQTLDFFPPSK